MKKQRNFLLSYNRIKKEKKQMWNRIHNNNTSLRININIIGSSTVVVVVVVEVVAQNQ